MSSKRRKKSVGFEPDYHRSDGSRSSYRSRVTTLQEDDTLPQILEFIPSAAQGTETDSTGEEQPRRCSGTKSSPSFRRFIHLRNLDSTQSQGGIRAKVPYFKHPSLTEEEVTKDSVVSDRKIEGMVSEYSLWALVSDKQHYLEEIEKLEQECLDQDEVDRLERMVTQKLTWKNQFRRALERRKRSFMFRELLHEVQKLMKKETDLVCQRVQDKFLVNKQVTNIVQESRSLEEMIKNLEKIQDGGNTDLLTDLRQKKAILDLIISIKNEDLDKIGDCFYQYSELGIPYNSNLVEEARKTILCSALKRELCNAIDMKDFAKISNVVKTISEEDVEESLQTEVNCAAIQLRKYDRIEKSKQKILSIPSTSIADIRDKNDVPYAIKDVFVALFLILGDHEGITREWDKCRKMLRTEKSDMYVGLWERIRTFNLFFLPPEVAARAKHILSYYSQDLVYETNQVVGLIRDWVLEMCLETLASTVEPEPAALAQQKNMLASETTQRCCLFVLAMNKIILKEIFSAHDTTGTGELNLRELREVLSACMRESNVNVEEDDLSYMTLGIYDACAEGEKVSYEALCAELRLYPARMENLKIDITNERSWTENNAEMCEVKHPAWKMRVYHKLRNNPSNVIFFGSFTFTNIVLLIATIVYYGEENGWAICANSFGMCLNFNCAFLVLPTLRYCLAKLGETRFRPFMVFTEENRLFAHWVVAECVALCSLLHIVGHLGNIGILSGDKNRTDTIQYWEYLFTTKPGMGWFFGTSPFTGILLLVTFLIIEVGAPERSVSGFQEKGDFKSFYWTHRLYHLFYLLLFLHSRIFMIFFTFPLIFLVYEKVTKRTRPQTMFGISRFTNTTAIEAILLSSQVTHLVLKRPKDFTFMCGDYVFAKFPNLALHEWHPLVITSTPKMTETLWLHVRPFGHWEAKVWAHFCKKDPETPLDEKVLFDNRQRSANRSYSLKPEYYINRHKVGFEEKITLEGPFKKADLCFNGVIHAVVITVDAHAVSSVSLIQDLVRKCIDNNQSKHSPESLRKVSFIWSTSIRKTLEWIFSLIKQLKLVQLEALHATNSAFDARVYMTGAKRVSDMKAVGLQMSIELAGGDNLGLLDDMIANIYLGQPRWSEVINMMLRGACDGVKIFYFGPNSVGDTIEDTCENLNLSFARST